MPWSIPVLVLCDEARRGMLATRNVLVERFNFAAHARRHRCAGLLVTGYGWVTTTGIRKVLACECGFTQQESWALTGADW
jgi:hypothetical protein